MQKSCFCRQVTLIGKNIIKTTTQKNKKHHNSQLTAVHHSLIFWERSFPDMSIPLKSLNNSKENRNASAFKKIRSG